MLPVTRPSVLLAVACTFAVLLGAFGTPARSAPIIVYHSEASFRAGTTHAATDSYDDLTGFVGGETPAASTALARPNIGPYGYIATSYSDQGLDCFYTGLNPNDPSDLWLGTNFGPDYVTFDTFSGGVSAIGGYFFSTDIDNFPTMTALLFTLTLADHTTLTITELQPDPTTFLGFSGSGIVSLRVDNLDQGVAHPPALSATVNDVIPDDQTFATVNNLILAQAVPEPELGALLALGALVGFAVRRRGSRSP